MDRWHGSVREKSSPEASDFTAKYRMSAHFCSCSKVWNVRRNSSFSPSHLSIFRRKSFQRISKVQHSHVGTQFLPVSQPVWFVITEPIFFFPVTEGFQTTRSPDRCYPRRPHAANGSCGSATSSGATVCHDPRVHHSENPWKIDETCWNMLKP